MVPVHSQLQESLLWPTEEVAVMVVMVFLLFNDSDNVSDIFLFVLKLVWEA